MQESIIVMDFLFKKTKTSLVIYYLFTHAKNPVFFHTNRNGVERCVYGSACVTHMCKPTYMAIYVFIYKNIYVYIYDAMGFNIWIGCSIFIAALQKAIRDYHLFVWDYNLLD